MADDQQQQTVRRVVIVGDGVDGWMAAAGLACAYGPSHQITVVAERVEDDPALVADPGFTTWLGIIGLHPAELLRSAAATFAHGVALQGADQPIFVPFVDWAPDLDGVALYHYWLTARATQGAPPLPAYMLCAQLAAQGRVALGNPQAASAAPHGFHLDSRGYVALLRRMAEQQGVHRIEGAVTAVTRDDAGEIVALELQGGTTIEGDLFVDASGAARKLAADPAEAAATWTAAAGSEALRSESMFAFDPHGYSLTIPLQGELGGFALHRGRIASNGIAHRTDRPWAGNCLAMGRAAGELPAVPWAQLSLAQKSVTQLVQLFPQQLKSTRLADEFNRRMAGWYDGLAVFGEALANRDTILRSDDLQSRIALFSASGRLPTSYEDPIMPSVWAALFIQQGVISRMAHPMAVAAFPGEIARLFSALPENVRAMAASLPTQQQAIPVLLRQSAVG